MAAGPCHRWTHYRFLTFSGIFLKACTTGLLNPLGYIGEIWDWERCHGNKHTRLTTPLRCHTVQPVISFRAKPELLDRVRRAAEARQLTLSAWLRAAVLAQLSRDEQRAA